MNYFYWKRFNGAWSPRLAFDVEPEFAKEERPFISPVQKTELVDLDQCVRVWPAPQEKSDG